MKTMLEALKICLPITVLTFALFTRTNLVVKLGWGQIGDVLLTTVGNCGFAFAMFGYCSRNLWGNILARILIASVAAVTLFHPNYTVVWAFGAITLIALIWGIRRHNVIAPMKVAPVPETEEGAALAADVAGVIAEAKRDMG